MRDYREISVAGEARSPRTAGPARTAAARAAAPRWGTGLRAALGLCRSHPGQILGGAVGVGVATAVSLNALGFQVGPHPAPILPKVAAKPEPAQPAPAVRTIERNAETQARAALDRLVQDKALPERPAAEKAHDAAMRVPRAAETTASVTPKAERAEKPEKAEAGVLQAQRALLKLGYGPLKADGMMGPGTKAAIEKFERAAKLPVKGEPTGRTLRELVQRAGAHG